MKQYILFGCGKEGKMAFLALGADRVCAFTDNNSNLWGGKYCGKTVIDLEKMRELANEHLLLVTANMSNGVAIADQLDEMGVKNYMFWRDVRRLGNWDDLSVNAYERLIFIKDEYQRLYRREHEQVEYLNIHTTDEDDRIQYIRDEKNKYEQLYKDEQQQVAKLKAENDVARLYPAEGRLREFQLKQVNFVADFFEKIKGLDLHPILAAGNLLGYIRHGGFIPWDDDIDVKMIRSEYEKLIEYCKDNMPVEVYMGKSLFAWRGYTTDELLWIDAMLHKHPNEVFLTMRPYNLRMDYGTSLQDRVCFDVYSLDCYGDDVSFLDHKRFIDDVAERITLSNTAKEQWDIINDAIQVDREMWDENGNNLFYGIDNVESYYYYVKNKEWLKKSDVFPCSKGVFEGREFCLPRNPRKCLEYVFGKKYLEFPARAGTRSFTLRRAYGM